MTRGTVLVTTSGISKRPRIGDDEEDEENDDAEDDEPDAQQKGLSQLLAHGYGLAHLFAALFAHMLFDHVPTSAHTYRRGNSTSLCVASGQFTKE